LAGYLTIMVVPHGTTKPRQLTLTWSFLLFGALTWIGLTGWAVYVSARHIDYWRSSLTTQLLNLKVAYLGSEVHKFNERIDEVKEVEARLRHLLQMGSREAIIQTEDPWSSRTGQGGPTPEETVRLQEVLLGTIKGLSWTQIQEDLARLRENAQDRLDDYKEITGWISKEKRLFHATPMGWPTIGRVTSHFGLRTSPLTHMLDFHTGIDIAGNWGSPIRATADGIVSFSGWEEGYGKLVIINHGFGFSSLYGHMSRILVKGGQTIYRNQVIGLMGATGHATGPHCHYEVWRYGKTINPYTYMLAQGLKNVQTSKKF